MTVAPVRPATTPYDDVPYESTSFPQTHPDRMATLGALFGLEPAPVDRCRVLELGCAMGANLVPMAFHLPGSEFVGVDASARQIATAIEAAGSLGLGNVRFEHASILDVDDSWGRFDYIICHGVYSWVSDEVRDGILAVASNNLAPQGVAYVSYNTYPGWHMREMIRHMMRYHAAQFPEPARQIEQARALLDFLARTADTSTYYGALLRSEVELVHRVRDSYLFHEHLEEVNAPVYFHEFVAHAGSHRLRYLAEAQFSSMLTGGFPAEVAATLERISPDIVHAEQYMDFLRNRFFRQTLLCHAELRPRRSLGGNDLDGLLLASSMVAVADDAPGSPGFRTPDGRRVSTSSPLTYAVLAVLCEHWPVALDQATLRDLAADRVQPAWSAEELERQWPIVLADMLHCYSTGAIELRSWQAPCARGAAPMPRLSPLAAAQLRTGTVVTNQRHESVPLDNVGSIVAKKLDGAHDRAGLLRELSDAVDRGEITLTNDGGPVTDPDLKRQALDVALGRTLESFARRALLVD